MLNRRNRRNCLSVTISMLLSLLCLPFILLYWLYTSIKSRKPKYRKSVGYFDVLRPSSRKNEQSVERHKTAANEGLIAFLHELMVCWNRCCCPFTFTDGLSLKDAIDRYEEIPNLKPSEVIKEIAENEGLSIILEYLNRQKPKFYFRVLPSGSIREGFGNKSPSTSVLATDYDLMLVPDGIFAYDVSSERNKDFPGTFIAVDDPNQNPDRPSGYLWLEFTQPDLKAWKKLCYERLAPDGVKYYLAQFAVLQMIRSEIGNNYFITVLKHILGDKYSQHKNWTAEANITGPALNIKIEGGVEKKGVLSFGLQGSQTLTILDADFTLAIRCPDFPNAGKYFFNRRREEEIFWPHADVVEKIKHLGCHIVPKPSAKKMTCFQEEQMTESYLGAANSLEWRYSFSQAEMLLADQIPPQARTAYLAFKATVKVHINHTVDNYAKPHSVQSYALKSILFYEVETKEPTYWDLNNPLRKTEFFYVLLKSLIEKVDQRHCPHYWIENVDLFQDMEEIDFAFFAERLNLIKANPVKYVASDWLEWNRFVRNNCCDCCIRHGKEHVVVEGESEPLCQCCVIRCSAYTNSQGCCTFGGKRMEYDAEALEVY